MPHALTGSERHARHYRRALRWGIGASVLFHLLILLWASTERVPLVPTSSAGEQTGDEEAAIGGGMQAVELRISEPQAIPRPPEPIVVTEPALEQPEPEETEVEPVDLAQLGPIGQSPGENQGEQPGVADGEGTGDGGTSSQGRSPTAPPNPRGIFYPPSPPGDVRGRTVTVYVFVNAQGDVVADSTRLSPSSGDRGFDRDIIRRANDWLFDPARRDGRAVAQWTSYSWQF